MAPCASLLYRCDIAYTMSRPERIAPPDLYYDVKEAGKYTGNSRIMKIQSTMADRCLELLNFGDGPKIVLDIGCGSGISGGRLLSGVHERYMVLCTPDALTIVLADVLSDAGHIWVGLDISSAMLGIARERDVDGDLFLGDIGQGFGFRAGLFDGCVRCVSLGCVYGKARLKRRFSWPCDIHTLLLQCVGSSVAVL